MKLAARPDGGFRPSDPFASFPKASMSRHQLLEFLHRMLQPRTYLETGVSTGLSMAISRAKSIGVDPQFKIATELCCDVQLVRTTSDEFFARGDPLKHFEGAPVDLAFIDGMHLSEFALRDFMNVEKFMAPTGVVVFDDMLPRNALEAARDRQTRAWTGDVFKVMRILAEQRPDLIVVPVNTHPTGTMLVLGFSHSSEELDRHFEANMARCRIPDPQNVPRCVLRRTVSADPRQITGSDLWSELRSLRDGDADRRAAMNAIRKELGRFAVTSDVFHRGPVVDDASRGQSN